MIEKKKKGLRFGKQHVKDFLLIPEVSREMPAKADAFRSVAKESMESIMLPKHGDDYGRGIQAVQGKQSWPQDWQYKESNPGHKIGLTSFRKLASENLKKISETNSRTCLCSSCCNVALKIESLKKFIKATLDLEPGCKVYKHQHSQSGETFLCPYDKFPTVNNKRLQFKFDDVAFTQRKDYLCNVKSLKFI